jgi:hypothetical protein
MSSAIPAAARQTGKMLTVGQAFDAMLEHATNAWMPPRSRVRAAHRVFARDGWRRKAQGCASFQNLTTTTSSFARLG